MKISEIFLSPQGEGQNIGQMTVWVRFVGCNLECKGFGQVDPIDDSTWSERAIDTIDAIDITSPNDYMPKTGCDSAYSVSKKFDHLYKDLSAVDVVSMIVDKLRTKTNPDGLFTHPITNTTYNLCFTGGEPMLFQRQIIEILTELYNINNNPISITLETNGTVPPRDEFLGFMLNYVVYANISPKLHTVSGETSILNKTTITSIKDYIRYFDYSILKFVISVDPVQWLELSDFLLTLDEKHTPVYVMPVGTSRQDQDWIGESIVELAKENGYHFSPRVQCYLFDNAIGK